MATTKNRAKTAAGRAAVVAAAIFCLSAVSVQAAHAAPSRGSVTDTKVACKTFNNVASWRQIPIPTSWICAYIGQGGKNLVGSGLNSLRQRGWFNTLQYDFRIWPAVCNYWVDFDIWDADGKLYYHNQGSRKSGCASTVLTTTGVRALNADWILRPSSEVCATIWRWKQGKIVRVARTCGVVS